MLSISVYAIRYVFFIRGNLVDTKTAICITYQYNSVLHFQMFSKFRFLCKNTREIDH